ncbi:MAG: DUF4340 domain-containing protein [Candidatus Moduliflexus flocculans]|nr:DUF4340 domain-containing protein [Candidatus Moduliflexus flocculans]
MASTLKTSLEKTVFDFRLKDVFKFAAEEVKGIRVRAKDVAWTARPRRDRAGSSRSPVAALAAKGKLDSLLDALAGLRAKAFVTEEKTAAALETYGLGQARLRGRAVLARCRTGRSSSPWHKQGEAQYATTSLSTKVVSFEGTLLADLDRKVDEIREKKVADLYAWDARSVLVRAGRPRDRGRQGEGRRRGEVDPRSRDQGRSRPDQGRGLRPQDRRPRGRGVHRFARPARRLRPRPRHGDPDHDPGLRGQGEGGRALRRPGRRGHEAGRGQGRRSRVSLPRRCRLPRGPAQRQKRLAGRSPEDRRRPDR